MTSRQRVLASVHHRQPDRVPFNIRLSSEVIERFKTETAGCDSDYETWAGCDLRAVRMQLPPRPQGLSRAQWMPYPSGETIAECAARAAQLRQEGLASYSGYVCGVFEEAKFWLGDVDTLTLPTDDPAPP